MLDPSLGFRKFIAPPTSVASSRHGHTMTLAPAPQRKEFRKIQPRRIGIDTPSDRPGSLLIQLREHFLRQME